MFPFQKVSDLGVVAALARAVIWLGDPRASLRMVVAVRAVDSSLSVGGVFPIEIDLLVFKLRSGRISFCNREGISLFVSFFDPAF